MSYLVIFRRDLPVGADAEVRPLRTEADTDCPRTNVGGGAEEGAEGGNALQEVDLCSEAVELWEEFIFTCWTTALNPRLEVWYCLDNLE